MFGWLFGKKKEEIDPEMKYLIVGLGNIGSDYLNTCLLYTSPSPRDQRGSRMPSSA